MLSRKKLRRCSRSSPPTMRKTSPATFTPATVEKQREGWPAGSHAPCQETRADFRRDINPMSTVVFLGGGRITSAMLAGLRLGRTRHSLVVHDRNRRKLRDLKKRYAVAVERDLSSA